MKDVQLKATHLLLLLFVAGVTFIVMSAGKPISDFGNYYYGAQFFAEGKNPGKEIYDVMRFNTNVEQAGETSFFLNHNTVSPQSMVLYRPFTWIGNAALAKIIFNLLGLIAFLWSLRKFLARFAPVADWKMGILFVAALIPVYYNIVFGQTYLFLTALIMEAVLQSEKRPWLSGIFLAVAISLKISPAIFLLWFVAERHYKATFWTIGMWLLFTGSLFVAMPGVMYEFYTGAVPRMMNGYVTDPYSSSFQSIVVFLRKMFSPDAILNPSSLYNGGEQLVHLINVLCLAVLGLLVTGAWKSGAFPRKKLLLLVLFVNITSGYTSTYSLLLLLPFIETGNTTRDWIRMMLYAALFMLPPRLFDGASPLLEEYKLWLFIAVFILEVAPQYSFNRIEKAQLVMASFFFAMVIVRFSQRAEKMPLTYYQPETITQDYVLNAVVHDSAVTYVAYAPAGFQQFEAADQSRKTWTPVDAAEFYVRGVHLRLIGYSGEQALVLSDYHRGPGLYHLYTISQRDFQQLISQ